MENNLKSNVIFPKMGWTEDERSNFMIDCFEMLNGKKPEAVSRPFQYVEGAKMEIQESPFPKSITITIKKQ